MKRLFFTLFVITLILMMAGCAPTAQKGTIKIGLQGPLTGDYAYEGQGFEKAVRLLVEQTNAAGGINGQMVELFVEDDKGDPKESALVADRMVAKKVIAVIGAYNSTATEPASEIYNREGILHITPSSTATRLTTKGYQQFFRVCFLDDRQGLFAAEFMTKILGNKNVAILHDNSTYAQGLAEWTKKYLEERGAKVVFYDAINPADKDFTPTLTKLKGANAETVYFTGYHAQGGLLLKQAPEVGLKIQWMMGNACNNPELIQIAGVENAKGAIFTTEPLPSDLDYPEAKKFIADFKAKYGEEPTSVWWVMAADAYRVIEHAIKTTNSTDPKKLAEYLHKDFKNFPGITGPILGFDEKGDRLGTIHKAYLIGDDGSIKPYPKQP
ncbi:MAG: branched-chain amino acid ABC transporter substrate-binding protein [Anaerolineae bacterium]|nr:branched-chain amino acid ABC transporter substrate-binding protein [Anaerolineae bacterium]